MCHGQAVIIEIVDEAGLHMLPEKLHKMRRAVVTQFGHLINRNGLLIVFMYVLYNKFQLLQRLLLGGSQSASLPIGNQKKEKLKQGAFQSELVAIGALFAELIHMADNGRKLIIVVKTGMNMVIDTQSSMQDGG